ncbi:MAG: fructose-bisphosphate aldolase [Anaerolineaceae bacterium]|nr:fructose-bisphosphate aldolase [Anaerolineaceae bacterium]
MSEIGKEVRLSRLFNRQSGNSVMVAMDHGAAVGPIKGIVDPEKTVSILAKEKPETFFMPVGIIKKVYKHFIENDIPYIAAIDSVTFIGPEPDYFIVSDTVEHAMIYGATAVSAHIFVGPEKTSEMMKGLSAIARECDRLGMPLLAIMYPNGFENDYDVKLVKHAARMAAEYGADIVKTYYTGSKESFQEVIEGSPLPVLLSGGDKTDNPLDFLGVLKNCMDAGGRGVAVGRNVWQADDPAKMLQAVKKVVHEGLTPEEALA